MSTSNLSVKYRPVRIGFLVREGNLDDLIKVAGINTLLWGGVYNPVIPVSATNKEFASQLLSLFSVDVLFAVAHSKEIDELTNANPFLKDPSHYAEKIFFQDWHTKKNVLGYLDSLNIVDLYWEKEFKHKSARYKSNCLLPKWSSDDPLHPLFSLLFGYFPSDYNLKEDFQNAFLKGLKSKEATIPDAGELSGDFAGAAMPINVTASELRGYGGTWRGNGVFIGSSTDFTDLVYFWNLRASGLNVVFLPKENTSRFKTYIKSHIKSLDQAPNENPKFEDHITIYHRDTHKTAQGIAQEFKGKRDFAYSHCDEINWNGLNIKPSTLYFEWQRTLASVEKDYGKYHLTASLPEKKFLSPDTHGRNVDSQQLVASIDPFSEFGYPGHTLKPPYLRQLNEFYGREIHFDPWSTRVERDGIGMIVKASDTSISLYPISHSKIIEKIYELAGFKATVSQAGLLTLQIIQGMRDSEPLEACRVFKITGVRKLLAAPETKKGGRVKRSNAIKTVWDANFSKFESLYIEARDSKRLRAGDAFNFLVKKRIFAPKLRLAYRLLRKRYEHKCRSCGLKEVILLSSYEGEWRCPSCHHVHYMPSYVGEDFQSRANRYWRFARSGLFAKDNNQEGAVPVIISLLVFARIFDDMAYATSVTIKGSHKCEIDFSILQYERGEKIQFGIAECKSEGQAITAQDVSNLKMTQNKINELGIECYLIFSKAADTYSENEIALFRTLKDEGRKFIILSNKELEPYHPYWELSNVDELPEKYALDMSGMQSNAEFLYLKEG